MGAIVLGIILVLGCVQGGTINTTPEGRVVFSITDAAANMGSVSKVEVTIDQVSVQSAAKGWVVISNQTKTYDLLELKAGNKSEILADANLAAGTYNQFRMRISNVQVTDANGVHTAKLPSNELKIVGSLIINDDSTSVASFDFIADESLHVTGNGTYILAPVIQIETRENASVDVKADGSVDVTGGRNSSTWKVGTDIQGNVGTGLSIANDKVLDIDAGGKITIATIPPVQAGKGNLVIGITDAAVNMQNVSKIAMTIVKVDIHSESIGWITLSDETLVFDLLALRDANAIKVLTNSKLEAGTYQQLRLEISKVVVTDINGIHDAKLPSGELKIPLQLDVNDGTTVSAKLDFIVDESLHITGNGTYVVAPVVHVETRADADVIIDEDKTIQISGGTIKTNHKVGMNAYGNVGINVSIPVGSTVNIQGNDVVIVLNNGTTPPANQTNNQTNPYVAVEACDSSSDILVSGELVIPAEIESFTNALTQMNLYEYDPFLADAGAEKKASTTFSVTHTLGTETRVNVDLCDEGMNVEPNMQYYVDTRIYYDGVVVPSGMSSLWGRCTHDDLCKVLNEWSDEFVTVAE